MRQIPGRAVGLRMVDASGQLWWFESGALVVDFAYTPSADLAGWLAERYPELVGPAGEGELTDARALHAAVSHGLIEGSEGAHRTPPTST